MCYKICKQILIRLNFCNSRLHAYAASNHYAITGFDATGNVILGCVYLVELAVDHLYSQPLITPVTR